MQIRSTLREVRSDFRQFRSDLRGLRSTLKEVREIHERREAEAEASRPSQDHITLGLKVHSVGLFRDPFGESRPV